VIDFTSALYLGMRHGHASLSADSPGSPWSSLTTGRPAALFEPASVRVLAALLAALQGCEAAVLVASTLHAFWDLFGAIERDVELLVDAGLYAVGRAGVERARARGAAVRVVSHYDEEAIRSAVGHCAKRRRRPVLVCDGVCVDCGRVAPLGRITPLLEAHGGRAIVDDTQGLGVVGASPSIRRPLGVGGGGSLAHQAATGSNTLVVASLAKAFGVPIAVVAGRRSAIGAYAAGSEVRVHSSPPSLAHVAAATRALRLNRVAGERLRARLLDNTVRFRRRAASAGVALGTTLFPVQTVDAAVDGPALHQALLRRGVRSVLRSPEGGAPSRARVAFVVTASHTPVNIEDAVRALALSLHLRIRDHRGEDSDHVDHPRRVHPVDATIPPASYGPPQGGAH
jgi:8-amino-7-oxononanoate synthase